MSVATLPESSLSSPRRELLNGDTLYEIVDGNVLELPPMSILAVWIASLLYLKLGAYALERRLGRALQEGLFILDAKRDLRRRPDVAFVSSSRWPWDRPLPATGDWEVVPDLAVEVVSLTDVFIAVMAKMEEYFSVGVAQVWIVLPNEGKVHVYESPHQVKILTIGDDLTCETLLPGFRLSLAEWFSTQA